MPPELETHIAPTPTLTEYAGLMLKLRLTRMLSHCDGVREGSTTEPVHQMRVWSRRTRAALELFHPCFESGALIEMEREIKRVADALGQARDLDVMIEKMTAMGASLPELQQPGVDAFVTELGQERALCQSSVDRAVARLQRFDLAEVLKTVVNMPEKTETDRLELAGRLS